MSENVVPAHQGRRILVVDDEASLLWAVARALQVKGYQVSTAESGEAALEELAACHFDMVITDIRMPGMDGFELVNWLRGNRPHTAVVMTTAFSSLETRERSMKVGALSYMEKPMDLKTLTDFLDRVFYTPRFSGRVSDIDLLDYLQLLTTTRKSKTVMVTRHQEVGRLVFEDGQIIHAECENQSGLDAFNEIMYWEGGAFYDIPFESPVKRTIEESTSFLLMEAARLRDEKTHEEELSGLRDGARTHSEDCRTTSQPDVDTSRTYVGPYAQMRKFVDGVSGVEGVTGALLVSREGLTLARSGAVPGGMESILPQLVRTFGQIGDLLNFGESNCGLLRSLDGPSIRIRLIGDYLLAVWLVPGSAIEAVDSWLDAHEKSVA